MLANETGAHKGPTTFFSISLLRQAAIRSKLGKIVTGIVVDGTYVIKVPSDVL